MSHFEINKSLYKQYRDENPELYTIGQKIERTEDVEGAEILLHYCKRSFGLNVDLSNPIHMAAARSISDVERARIDALDFVSKSEFALRDAHEQLRDLNKKYTQLKERFTKELADEKEGFTNQLLILLDTINTRNADTEKELHDANVKIAHLRSRKNFYKVKSKATK
jgi:hypothetical protein